MSITTSANAVSLYQLLKNADLLEYNEKLRHTLKLRHAGDIEDCEDKDLTLIGMSRPEQKRLRREYQKLYPQSSFVVKLRKVFGGGKIDDRKSDIAPTTPEFDDEQHIIPSSSVELCRELGRGEFGVCFQGTWTFSHGDAIQVAIKRVPPEKLKTNPACFLQEAAVMTKMRHEHVIRMYGVVLETKYVMLISELAPYGSLLDCLRTPAWGEPFAVDQLCEFARQIASGMNYLTGKRLIHRDLAARNVLVSTLTKVKISDFGLSRCLGTEEEYYRSDFSPTLRLPIAWCAPECINILKFTSASDVYAYGVTLWELFSYGKMPWEGYTGSQILHSIDTQRKTLDCPDACPTQIYSLMKRCWAHDANQRPKFEEIVELIPELMPQLLIAAVECQNKQPGRLQFTKGDTIILLDKSRKLSTTSDSISSDSSNLWHGALRNGQTGLFKPEETVAYLGAENPSSTRLVPLANGQIKIVKETASKKPIIKASDKEKKKLLISEPQGDLRHTCHIGVDGRVFGLIHINKNDLSKTLPPLIGLSDPASLSTNNMSPPSAISPAARSTSTASTCSSSIIQTNNRQSSQRSAGNQCISPTIASVRELGTKKPDTIIQNGYDIPQRMPKSFQMTPPALPPKPAARIKPQRSLATDSISTSIPKQPSIAHRTQSLPKGSSTSTGITFLSSTSSSDLTRPKSITVENGGFLVDSKAITEPVDNMSRSFHDSSQLLDEVLTTLQKDISDFSLSTINDFSDTRPLLKSSQRRNDRQSTEDPGSISPTHVRTLTEPETERLSKRINDEHKKAARSLAKEFEEFKRLSSIERQKPSEQEIESSGNYTSKIGSNNNDVEWSSEAQAAYKLLIECGDYLKTTSPTDRLSKSPNAVSTSTDDTDSTVRNLAPPLPPKKIQYINNTLVGSEEWNRQIKENDEVERVEIVDQRQTLVSKYENVKSDDSQPPIPPKAKARQNFPPRSSCLS